MNKSQKPSVPTDIMQQYPRAKHLGLILRPVLPSDMSFLTLLYRSTRETELARVRWTEAEKQAFINMQFTAQHKHYQAHYPNAAWLVIEQETNRIGRLYLEQRATELRIIDIALLPEHRGKGFGQQILQDLQDSAAEAKKSIGIHVEKMNPAMNLYQRMGFEKIEDKGVYDLLVWHLGRN